MLPKPFRLKAPDFFRTKTRYQKLISPHLVLMARNTQGTFPRFVIVVQKSIDKRSSYRHTLRRFLEEEIRAKYMKGPNLGDIYIKVQKTFSVKDSERIQQELGDLIQKISQK